jgi:hypothetical protein
VGRKREKAEERQGSKERLVVQLEIKEQANTDLDFQTDTLMSGICCVIQSTCELNLKPEFWSVAA